VDVLSELLGQDPRPGVRILAFFELMRDRVAAASSNRRAVAIGHDQFGALEDIREIAFTERKKVHGIIVEALDAAIAKRGHSETAL